MTLLTRLYSPVVVETDLPAPVEDVYAALTDPTTYPDWLVGAQEIRGVDDEFPKAGSEFRHSVGPSEGLTMDDTTESLGVAVNRHVALAVNAGPIHGRVDFDLEPVADDATATHVTFSERPTGFLAIFTPFLRPHLATRNLESLRRLRKHLS